MNNATSRIGVAWLVAVLGFGLLLSIGIGLAVSAVFHPLLPNGINLTKGQAVFDQRCAGCHSVLPNQIGGLGPNLSEIGRIAENRVDGQTAEQYILESILYPENYRADGVSGHMPAGTVAGVAKESVQSLVGYLIGKGGSLNEARLLALDVDTEVLEIKNITINVDQIQHGRNLFFNELGCSGCHGILGLPGDNFRAPSLAKAGLLSEEYILKSIRTPSADISSQWRFATVTLNNDTILSGRVLQQSKGLTTILTRNGAGSRLLETQQIPEHEIKTINFAEQSSMPPYTLTIKDEQSLVAFLSVLIAEL